MTMLRLAALGASMIALSGGAAFAQDSMMTGDHTMASKGDMKKMDHCKSMDHDMMMKSRTCMKMMKMHPEMMKGDSAMTPK